jgi:serine/threonine-protein kinase
VKPGNLLISQDTGAAKLADFGIAKAAEQTRITQVGSVLGTAAYLSPEQAAGEEAGPASDLYSLGVCAYQFLTGRLPHEYGSLTELALKQQNERVTPITDYRDDVPPALDRAIRAALERDIGARYTNALEMADGLEAGLAGEDTDITAGLDEWDDATGYLEDTSDATQALPRGDTAYVPPGRRSLPSTDVHAASQRRQAEEYRPIEQRPRKKNRNWGGWIAAVLALCLAAVAVYLALGLGSDSEKINRSSVSDQSDALIQYIRDHEANN